MRADGLAWVIETSSSNGPWCAKVQSIRFRLFGAPIAPRSIAMNDQQMDLTSAAQREHLLPLLDQGRKLFEVTLPFRPGNQRYRFEY
jgi:hypothetical protein